MPSKIAIIENVDMYSAEELVGYIKGGIISFEELCKETEGYFPAKTRKEVERLLKGSEDEDWKRAVNSKSVAELENYLATYTDGKHRDEARRLIVSFQQAEENASADSEWNAVDKIV
jgi:hypothetical protein